MSSEADTEWGRAIDDVAHDPRLHYDQGEEDQSSYNKHRPSEQVDDETEIAIVGGGLVGLATAIGLSKRGIPCKVYERAPKLRSVSQGMLMVQPNGIQALKYLDPAILSSIQQVGSEHKLRIFSKIDSNGTVTDTETSVEEEDRTKYGHLRILITWQKMQQALASLLMAAPDELIVTGYSLSHFLENNDDSVVLFFENGKKVRAKAVLACDGVFSTVRRQMFHSSNNIKNDDSPIYFGQLNWGSVLPNSQVPVERTSKHPAPPQKGAVHAFSVSGPPARFSAYLNDAGSEQTFWQVRVADPEYAMSMSGNHGRGGLGLHGVKKALLEVVQKSVVPQLANVIEQTEESQIFERAIVARQSLPTWLSKRNKRLALVGDAAHGMHPTIGQGANSGFESAAAVVEAIQEEYGKENEKGSVDYSSALVRYEAKRKPRADLVQAFANLYGVSQATGKEIMSRAQGMEVGAWIERSDPNEEPPVVGAQIIRAFDPYEHPGVAPLWK